MKKFALALWIINVMTFLWLMIVTPNLLPWKNTFDEARTTINNIELTGENAAMNQAILNRQLTIAETKTQWTIAVYRRTDAALGLMAIINIVGLAIIAFSREPISRA